jgi:uncharacterized phiE125 gp8 family phage protein
VTVWSLEIKTPPASEPVSVLEAKKHLRVEHANDDTYIETLILAAREWGEAFQNRSWITRTLVLHLNGWPEKSLLLPHGPVQSIVSITYTIDGGDTFTVDPGIYRFLAGGRLDLRNGKTWPAIPLDADLEVFIEYTAGYGDTAAEIPARFRQAVLLLVGHWYENREEVLVGDAAEPLPYAAEALLRQERVFPL